jgi:tetratricopeptide (TPR) repeat protein
MWRQRQERSLLVSGVMILPGILYAGNLHAETAMRTGKVSSPNSLPATQQQPVEKITPGLLQNAIEKSLENEDFFEAEALLKQAPEATLKENAKFLFYRAVVAKGLYRLNEAETLLKLSLRKDKNDGDALFEMALLLMEKKRWRDAEVLLHLASEAQGLSARRQSMLPYYLGVASFESGKIFSARNSFSRLNWANSLDPALEQSAGAFLGRIARIRPWSLIVPLTYQYESNMLGIPEATALPEGYSQRQGSKLIAGAFTSWNGLGGTNPGEGPWGLALRLLTIRALPEQFRALNVLFIEPELNWSRFLGEKWGMLKWAAVANRVSAGGKAMTASGLLRVTFLETEATAGFEADLQKSQSSERSAYVMRLSREWPLWTKGPLTVGLPTELGAKIPVDKKRLGEQRLDAVLAPSLGWTLTRRASLKVGEKFAYERVSDALSSTYSLIRNTPSLTLSFTAEPYLVLSSSFSFEFEKKSNDPNTVKKASASFSVLGIL